MVTTANTELTTPSPMSASTDAALPICPGSSLAFFCNCPPMSYFRCRSRRVRLRSM